MQDDVKRALDDVSEIKRVLKMTLDDFSSATKLFIVAGLFWIVEGIFSILNLFGIWSLMADDISIGTKVTINSLVSLAISLFGFTAVLIVFIICRKEQKRHAKGLGLQLIDIWGCLFIGVTLLADVSSKISTLFSFDKITQYVSLTYLFLMAAMPLVLMMTGILLGSTAPKIMAGLYVIFNLVVMALPMAFEYTIGENMTVTISAGAILSTAIIPGLFTFLWGIIQYRKSKRV